MRRPQSYSTRAFSAASICALLIAVLGPLAPHAAAANAVVNGGAETNTTGWNTSGSGSGVTLTRSTAAFHGGAASFMLTTPGTFGASNAVMNDSPNWITSSPGTTCTATAWFKGSASGMQAKLQLRSYAGATNVGSQVTSLVMNDTAWHQLSVTLPVAAGNSIDLNPLAYRPLANQSLWVDDITEDCSGAPANTAPTAALAVSPASGTVPVTVALDASASADAENNISTYTFNFGDGTAVAGPQAAANTSHTYTAAGTYTATVTVADAGGLTGTASKTVIVSPSGPTNTAPTAALSVSPASGTAPLSTTLDAGASTDAENNISTYAFDFGDGTAPVSQAGPALSHTYATTGTFTAQVTVTDAGGLSSAANKQITVTAASGNDPILAAAGDIACAASSAVTASSCHQQATANLLSALNASVIAPLGDIQYGNWCTSAGYETNLGANWGAFKNLMRPVPGNHEYNPVDTVADPTCPASGYVKGTGYFDYYNGAGVTDGAAGDRSKGYYSYDLGAWHIVVLNSEKDFTTTSSAQLAWLRTDLAAHASGCQMALFHRPRWSSGPHGSDGNQLYSQYVVPVLNQYGVDVLLSGHDHDYERFAQQDANGVASTLGIRQFVVGTGGNSHYAWGAIAPNSEVRNNDTFGVLAFTLHPGSYDWNFVPEAGKTFTDAGSTACH